MTENTKKVCLFCGATLEEKTTVNEFKPVHPADIELYKERKLFFPHIDIEHCCPKNCVPSQGHAMLLIRDLASVRTTRRIQETCEKRHHVMTP